MTVAWAANDQAKESGTCELVLVRSLFPAHSAGKGFRAHVLKRHAETLKKYLFIILVLVTISQFSIYQSGHRQLIIHRKSYLLTIMYKKTPRSTMLSIFVVGCTRPRSMLLAMLTIKIKLMLYNVVNFCRSLHMPTIHVPSHVDHKKSNASLHVVVPIVRELWSTVAWAARALLLKVQF